MTTVGYLARRLALAAAVVLVVLTILAALVHFIPGDPVKTILGPRATPELSATVREEMGLDKSVPQQVIDYIAGAVQGDLGRDFSNHVPVTTLLRSVIPHTLILAVVSLALAVFFALPLGVYAATHPNTWLDRITGAISISLITIPPYVAGLLLVLVFAVYLKWLPAIGAGDLEKPLDYGRHLILPAVALAVTWVGYLARLVRASMLEVLGSPYIRASRSFGIPERTIAYRYALRNAIIPTIAIIGVGLGSLMSLAVFVEVIFARPGLGSLIVTSIQTRNYPVVRGCVLVVAVVVICANLIADLAYHLLDPRLRKQGARS